ncbi:MAG: hypothetical protein A2156_00645 [Deltaproteobacteria bacterium RBG_16_48_10]|nr:MAG: hypothetical protein A2156_00645 [Deltaproteobacteria bacterium RBG_16_48_10]
MRLFEAGRIGRLHLKNRIVMSSINSPGNINPDGTLSQRGIDYYIARAKGGVGLIITGASRVSREFEYSPRLHRVLFVDGSVHTAWLSELADALHDYGAKVAVQFQPGRGRIAREKVSGSGVAVAPSPLPCFFTPDRVARELTVGEIERLVKAFEGSAETVRNAGIDAIELNFHAGYLGDEFVTSLWNKRTDAYGGSLEGRLRFPQEIIKAVKSGAGAEFPVIYKFGLTHYLEGGREIEEGLEIARSLEAAGVDALTIDAGCYETQYWTFAATYQPPGCMVDLSEKVKQVVKIPVIAVGKLGYPELAERVLVEGKADFIALGRALLADPEWANKVKAGRMEDIRPCIGDNDGCMGRSAQEKYVSCTVNPATGVERQLAITPAERKKSVLIVGGGPGGMEAARVAAARGHQVVLWEKGNALGGNLIPASVPDFKQDYRRLIDYLATQVRTAGVAIEFGREATPELVLKMNPEVVIVATGATAVIPEIPGTKKEEVVTASDVLLGNKEIGESVVVLGGGIVGFETALYLKQKEKKVVVVELLDRVMRNVFSTSRMYLLKEFRDSEILISTKVLEVKDKGIAIENRYGKRDVLKADTVVIATGFQSNKGPYEGLRGRCPELYAIGDCIEPRKVLDAIWEGYRLARLI